MTPFHPTEPIPTAIANNTLADPEQFIADLQRQLAECKAERDKAQRDLNETKTERDEALAERAAIAEVLGVINSSPGDLAPVFDAMLERAVRLCEFDFASLWTFDGNAFHPVASHEVPDLFWQYLQDHTPPAFARALAGERLIHIPDVQRISAYMET